jgi:hypothetical protein
MALASLTWLIDKTIGRREGAAIYRIDPISPDAETRS